MSPGDSEIMQTNGNQEEERPAVPVAGIIYGDIVYWGTILATVIVLIGSVVTFVTDFNYIAPSYLLSSIWEGKPVDEIWQGATGAMPEGHWYLSELNTGNGVTTAGLAFGVFTVIPAILAAAVALYRDGQALFGSLAVVAALITIAAMTA